MICYIAGPFRAKTPWLIEQNIRRAESVGLEVAKLGHVPIIPHSMYRFFQDSLPDEFWLAATLSMVRMVDCLVLVEGWEDSSGTKAEIERAEARGAHVFYSIDEFTQHIEDHR